LSLSCSSRRLSNVPTPFPSILCRFQSLVHSFLRLRFTPSFSNTSNLIFIESKALASRLLTCCK
jgi:hypothetical protein